ncbi:hypothetical protein NSZ01_04990 [Nocardioides szechwanensis]|uniref:Uncharacterized protein n=2 Tax=Nocardioides szechwanensis TaxID=1005944 RepID=A0A1G9W6T5_9ACTN|nr:hypothetical protein NSZ01_04990 [Nocardioides szechwanensis]SDM79911.1 hypothetical protein SAMN05192576_0957 [Nocardioides szechwanensis]
MIAYPTSTQVLDDLGDKVVHGFSSIVAGSRADLAEYRAALPHAVARASGRGLASWVHDAMWARAVDVFDDITEVQLHESGPTRDIYVGLTYHLRLKRHSPTGAIRSYPTQSALDFITQEPDLFTLLGIRQLNLCVGYEWDAATREIGGAVMSLRDGSFDEVIWMIDLPAAPATGTGTVAPITPTTPDIDGPSTPIIAVPRLDAADDTKQGNDTP